MVKGELNSKIQIPKSKFICHLSFVVLCLSLLTFHFSLLYAQDPKGELEEIQKKLSREKEKVKETIKRERSILSELEEIDKALKKKREELSYYDKRLRETRQKIMKVGREIADLNSQLEKRKSLLKERLRSLYKQQHGEAALILISAQDYHDLIKKSRYISFIAYCDRKLMETYKEEIQEREIKMQEMEELKRELEVNKQKVKNKAEEIQAERHRKDLLLASVKRERHSYEKMVKELEEASKRLLEKIKELEEKETPLPVIGKGFADLKGRLPWPINGKIMVPFGRYKDPQFNIPVFKNGIEIQVETGETVKAVAGGRVVFADWFKGYGQLLIVNHGGGYHTLYANLSEIFHKVGDIIKQKEAIGKVGESGTHNAPSLYFEIRHKGKPLNPLQWLREK